MPHLQVHVAESLVVGREQALIARLTDAVVEVYGAHFRDSVQVVLGEAVASGTLVHLVAEVSGRTGVGGDIAF